MERRLEEYESRRWWPFAAGMVGIGVGCVLGLAADSIGLALLGFVPGVGAAIFLSEVLGVPCPQCGRRIQYGAYGHTSHVDILRNMHQCPHCQTKFPD